MEACTVNSLGMHANKAKRVAWAQRHLNDSFENVIWTDVVIEYIAQKLLNVELQKRRSAT